MARKQHMEWIKTEVKQEGSTAWICLPRVADFLGI